MPVYFRLQVFQFLQVGWQECQGLFVALAKG
jgi:hypothetical protein